MKTSNQNPEMHPKAQDALPSSSLASHPVSPFLALFLPKRLDTGVCPEVEECKEPYIWRYRELQDKSLRL